MSHLLFVLHEASRTGAPFTQLHLMRWIKKHTSYNVSLILMWGGDLVSEFKKLGEVYIVDEGIPARSLMDRAMFKLDKLTDYKYKRMIALFKKKNTQMIFSNSAITIDLSVKLKEDLNIKLALNVHELESTFDHYSADNFAEKSVKLDCLVPGSYKVKEYFKSFCPIEEKNIRVVYDFIGEGLNGNTTAQSIRAQHGIPAQAKLVGAIAAMVYRKGADVFIRVAQEILKQDPDIYFMWVGGKPNSYQLKEVIRDVERLGLQDRVLFVGGKADLKGYYEAFDVFLLTSREDPFPLVCLEAGLAGTPIICFAEAGGMPEFVRDDAGFVVPYLDTTQMAEKTLLLLNNPELARQKGEVARQRVEANHTIDTIGPAMYEVIQQLLPAGK